VQKRTERISHRNVRGIDVEYEIVRPSRRANRNV
jgi:hypothetical protein